MTVFICILENWQLISAANNTNYTSATEIEHTARNPFKPPLINPFFIPNSPSSKHMQCSDDILPFMHLYKVDKGKFAFRISIHRPLIRY